MQAFNKFYENLISKGFRCLKEALMTIYQLELKKTLPSNIKPRYFKRYIENYNSINCHLQNRWNPRHGIESYIDMLNP